MIPLHSVDINRPPFPNRYTSDSGVTLIRCPTPLSAQIRRYARSQALPATVYRAAVSMTPRARSLRPTSMEFTTSTRRVEGRRKPHIGNIILHWQNLSCSSVLIRFDLLDLILEFDHIHRTTWALRIPCPMSGLATRMTDTACFSFVQLWFQIRASALLRLLPR